MTRRGFLGSLLGTVASYPFWVRLPTEPLQILPLASIKEYSLWIEDQLNGMIIQAPGIKHILETSGEIEIAAHKIDVVQSIKATRAILFDNRIGKTVYEFTPFQHPVHAHAGDSIILTGTIKHTSSDALKLDEVIRRGMKI